MELEKLSGSKVKVTSSVDAQQFEKALDKAFEKEQKEVQIKGWRKGHVPRSVYEKQFGVESLYYEAISILADELYFPIIMENKLNVAGDPEIDIDIQNIKRGEEFKIGFIIPLFPEVILGQYKGLKAKAKKTSVTEKEVTDVIKNLLSQSASSVPKTTGNLTNGDTAIFDFAGYHNGVAFEGGTAQNYELEIGSNKFIPGFEEQMIKMVLGEEKTINVTFPEGYQEASLAGQPVEFKIKLNEMKTKEMPELNDEFAKAQNYENVNTVEELKAHLKNNMKQQKEASEQERLTSDLIEAACKNATLEIPEAMLKKAVEDEIKELSNNVNSQYGVNLDMFKKLANIEEADFNKQMNERATRRLTETLVLEAIVKKENIQATEEEINKHRTENNKDVTNAQIAFHIEINQVIDLLITNAELK